MSFPDRIVSLLFVKYPVLEKYLSSSWDPGSQSFHLHLLKSLKSVLQIPCCLLSNWSLPRYLSSIFTLIEVLFVVWDNLTSCHFFFSPKHQLQDHPINGAPTYNLIFVIKLLGSGFFSRDPWVSKEHDCPLQHVSQRCEQW